MFGFHEFYTYWLITYTHFVISIDWQHFIKHELSVNEIRKHENILDSTENRFKLVKDDANFWTARCKIFECVIKLVFFTHNQQQQNWNEFIRINLKDQEFQVIFNRWRLSIVLQWRKWRTKETIMMNENR